MNFSNPTPLRIGARGALNGRTYTVAGRVVLGMQLDGTTYYWNEFHLVDEWGKAATLVYEEGEYGPDWKLFTMFEPSSPMTAQEAASKRVGDSVSLDGNPIRITLVDESEVYHIEGTAPEGVQEGDVADYFNAESAQRMIVVSWTGDEVEFFRGANIGYSRVAAAFNLPRPAFPSEAASRFSAPRTNPGVNIQRWIFGLLCGVIALGITLGIHSRNSHSRRSAPLLTQSAPVPQLKEGMAGNLAAQHVTIVSEARIEVSKMDARFERHEYVLATESGEHLLLVDNLDGQVGWQLLRPPPSLPHLGPVEAAQLRLGNAVPIEGSNARITGLFQAKTLACSAIDGFGSFPGTIVYGFVARSTNECLMARWTGRDFQIFNARELPASVVLTAFEADAKATK
ncbi:MAG: hypothetical protein RLY20_971 [Verrucomicrobiota bacterium]|jgi:hypothetical protein